MSTASPTYKGQFALASELNSCPAYWNSYSIGNKKLAYCPSLKLQKINVANTGNTVGYILGFYFNPHPSRNSIYFLPDGSEESFEEFLYKTYGRFIGIYAPNNRCQKIFLDPAGTMPVLYSESYKAVTSTPAPLLGDRYYDDFDYDLYRKINMPNSDLWFPGQLTPHLSFRRLIPNHYLNLSTWTPKRHWPKKPPKIQSSDPSEQVNSIISNLQNGLAYFSEQQKLHLSLTAGRDARMLMAVAKPYLKRVDFFTFSRKFKTVDEFYAQKIARDHNLNWVDLPIVKASKSQRQLWLKETGHAISGNIWHIHPTLSQLNNGIITPGMGGEVGRAFYWETEDDISSSLTVETLLDRYQLPKHPKFKNAVNDWLKSVKPFDIYTQLDLAYIEQRLGCWGSPQINGNQKFGHHFYPFSHREIFEAMLQLPPNFRRNNLLPDAIIRKEWPELLEYPFNRFEGIDKIRGWFLKSLRIPSYFRSKVLPRFKN